MESFFGIDMVSLVRTAGYLGLFFIVFAESGLFFGFFLPGDSLLFTAGFLAAQGYLNIYFLVVLCVVAAITGDNVGYSFGYRFGGYLFRKEDARFFKKEYLSRTRAFYQMYGRKALILARFLPVVRTFAPILAGVGKMRYAEFLLFNCIGALLWAAGFLLIGFFLGHKFSQVEGLIIPIIAVIVVCSLVPVILEIIRKKKI